MLEIYGYLIKMFVFNLGGSFLGCFFLGGVFFWGGVLSKGGRPTSHHPVLVMHQHLNALNPLKNK